MCLHSNLAELSRALRQQAPASRARLKREQRRAILCNAFRSDQSPSPTLLQDRHCLLQPALHSVQFLKRSVFGHLIGPKPVNKRLFFSPQALASPDGRPRGSQRQPTAHGPRLLSVAAALPSRLAAQHLDSLAGMGRKVQEAIAHSQRLLEQQAAVVEQAVQARAFNVSGGQGNAPTDATNRVSAAAPRSLQALHA